MSYIWNLKLRYVIFRQPLNTWGRLYLTIVPGSLFDLRHSRGSLLERGDLGPVYTIPFSFHIGLVSYRIGLLFTRYRFHSMSDWPPVYMRTHQSDMLHAVFAFSNQNFLKVS